MNYESTQLRSCAEALYKTAPFVWPIFILAGTSAGFLLPFSMGSLLGDLALPIGTVLAVIGFLIGYASSVVVVSLLRIYALKALRIDDHDRNGRLDINESPRISLTS